MLAHSIALILALAAEGSSGKTVFPSDQLDPVAVAEAEPELMRAACPHFRVNKGVLACDSQCPAYSSFPGLGVAPTVEAVYRGHFLAPDSDDAWLWITGCESHSSNWGTAIVVTRKSDGWSWSFYKQGLESRQCHKFTKRDGREALVCIALDGGQGFGFTALFVIDPVRPACPLMCEDRSGPTFFAVHDTTRRGCFEDRWMVRGGIESVTFGASSVAGSASITVVATGGSREIAESELGRAVCPKPPVRSYTLDFFYDGRTFVPTSASVPVRRVFEDLGRLPTIRREGH